MKASIEIEMLDDDDAAERSNGKAVNKIAECLRVVALNLKSGFYPEGHDTINFEQESCIGSIDVIP